MSERKAVRRALVSVYDKSGLIELATGLHEAGVELVSTGSTASKIADAVTGGRGIRESAQAEESAETEGDDRRRARPARQARPEQATSPASV